MFRTILAKLWPRKGSNSPDFGVRRREAPLSPAHSPKLIAEQARLIRKIDAVDWASFSTAYGDARTVPVDLKLLLFGNERQAKHASHRLWCGLCHQHAYLSTGAEPALPFLIEGLQHSNDSLKVDVLDILLGFVVCHDPNHAFTSRILESVALVRPLFETLRDASPSADLKEFATMICDSLTEKGA